MKQASIMMLMMIAGATGHGETGPGKARDSLKGLPKIMILVEGIPAAPGLERVLKADIENQLKSAGVPLVPSDADADADDKAQLYRPWLYLNVNIVGTGSYFAYNSALELVDYMVPFHNSAMIRASAWSTASLEIGSSVADAIPPYPEPPPQPTGAWVFDTQTRREYEARKGQYYLKLSIDRASTTARPIISTDTIRERVREQVNLFIADWNAVHQKPAEESPSSKQ